MKTTALVMDLELSPEEVERALRRAKGKAIKEARKKKWKAYIELEKEAYSLDSQIMRYKAQGNHEYWNKAEMLETRLETINLLSEVSRQDSDRAITKLEQIDVEYDSHELDYAGLAREADKRGIERRFIDETLQENGHKRTTMGEMLVENLYSFAVATAVGAGATAVVRAAGTSYDNGVAMAIAIPVADAYECYTTKSLSKAVRNDPGFAAGLFFGNLLGNLLANILRTG
ncbi:TPA: hypothetical protein HA265_06455 [Candidatus Woesearchaeota archaeon]|nr:hypothetical protein [Candidatus Woesearchaeota archaeon]